MCSTAKGINFALKGFATQSSTYNQHNRKYNADFAIDGSTDAALTQGSCTLTVREDFPWWKVMFEYDILVSEIVIVNRGDCCGK